MPFLYKPGTLGWSYTLTLYTDCEVHARCVTLCLRSIDRAQVHLADVTHKQRWRQAEGLGR